MKIAFLSMFFFLLLLVPIAYAETIKTCIDSDTLQVNTTTVLGVNGNITTIDTTEDIYCPYGCSNNQCTPGAILNIITFPVFVVLFAFFTIIGRIFDNPLFGTIASTVAIIIGTLLISQGILLGDTILSNIYIQGFGMIFLVLGIYLVIAAWGEHITGKREEKKAGEMSEYD